ncbi:MAG: c-type cytochrome [Mariprofundaceae bacterium]
MKKIIMIAAAAAMIAGFTASTAYAGAEAKCKACHDFGSKHKVGPSLAGVFGRDAGSTDFAKYGASLKKGGWKWDEANLRKWIENSKKAIKELSGDAGAKTKMPPQKLTGKKADDVIAFLKGL